MKLTEQIQLPRSRALSALCHRAKNLHNLANFYVRQFFFHLGERVWYADLDFMLKGSALYRALPAQTAQQVLRVVDQNWRSFFAATREYKKNPQKFLGRPRPPRYKRKDGECVAIFTSQNARVRGGAIHFPRKAGLSPLKTRLARFQQVRVVPKNGYYIVEIVHEVPEQDPGLDPNRIVGIDIGVANLLAVANNVGLCPLLVRGTPVKAINQYFNKARAKLQSTNNRQGRFGDTRRLQGLTRRRANKIFDYFHRATRLLVDYCLAHAIGRIVVGYNELWKQRVHLGRRANQQFVGIPFYRLVRMIHYKARLVGIQVDLTPEDYTSKCSLLDLEPVGKRATYAGRRVHRGLFRASGGRLINADINGAGNILRKVVPNAFTAEGIEAMALSPQVLLAS